MVFISDPKLLRQILSKDFEYFKNHKDFSAGTPIVSEVLDFLEGLNHHLLIKKMRLNTKNTMVFLYWYR